MRRTGLLALVATIAGIGVVLAHQDAATGDNPFKTYLAVNAPPSLHPALQRAEKAFGRFQSRLYSRVDEELQRGGALAALEVYRDEAAQLVTTITREDRLIRMGRTSHKLRNYRNAPPEWASALVTEAAGRDSSVSPTWVVELGTAVGVIAPLETRGNCVICHGPVLSPELAGAIRKAYPGDQATGFAPGQVRGWVWAELARR